MVHTLDHTNHGPQRLSQDGFHVASRYLVRRLRVFSFPVIVGALLDAA